MKNDIYVVVADNDVKKGDWSDKKGPIVFEQYVNESDLEDVKLKAEILKAAYGKCRIAKLVFIEDE